MRAHPLADVFDQIQAEALPVGIAAQAAPVEGGVGQLLEQVALVAVEVYAVQPANLRVRGGLARVFDNALELAVREAHAGNIRDVEIWVKGSGHREFQLVNQALRVAHPAEARR